MDQLAKAKAAVAKYFSPRANRRRTINDVTPLKATEKFAASQRPFQPTSEPRNGGKNRIINGRICKKYLSPTDTKHSTLSRNKAARLAANANNYASDYSSITSGPSVAIAPIGISPAADDSDDSESESVLQRAAKTRAALSVQESLERRRAELQRVAEAGWHPDMVLLYSKLSMRGFEVLLPHHWLNDFPTCPGAIFSDDENATFINSTSGKDFRGMSKLLQSYLSYTNNSLTGIRALQSLVSMGSRVRDLTAQSIAPEGLIEREIKAYMKWAEKDGGFYDLRHIPVLAVVSAVPGEDLENVNNAMNRQLQLLALQYRRAFSHPPPGIINEAGQIEIYARPPPVIYGIIILQTATVFVAVDAAKPAAPTKLIAHFNFSNTEMDVWNGFAIAIMVCNARNYVVSIRDSLAEEEPAADDPDL